MQSWRRTIYVNKCLFCKEPPPGKEASCGQHCLFCGVDPAHESEKCILQNGHHFIEGHRFQPQAETFE